ncbi:MAG: DUF4347 domain-containing protein [Cyanobacteria bacterium P01_F01_bin.150]
MNTQTKHTFLDHPFLSSCHTVVFDSPKLETYKDLSPSLPGTVRRTLSPHCNGVKQIANVLAICPHIQTVHIYAPGEPGKLILGCVQLTVDSIDHYAWDIQAWFGFIPPFIQPSLILDGCNVGDGKEGTALIHQLRQLTGSHITCRQSDAQRHLHVV